MTQVQLMDSDQMKMAKAISDQLAGKPIDLVIEVLLALLAFSITKSPDPVSFRDQTVAGLHELTKAYHEQHDEAAPWAN